MQSSDLEFQSKRQMRISPFLTVGLCPDGAQAALIGHLLHVSLRGELLQLRLLVVQQLCDLRVHED